MKTKMNHRVKKYLRDATIMSNSIRRNKVLTSDYLLMKVMQDSDNELGKFLERKGWSGEEFIEDLENTEILSEEEKENFYVRKEKSDIDYSERVINILQYADKLAKSKGVEEIDVDCLNVAIAQNDNPAWEMIANYQPDIIGEIKEYFSKERYLAGQIEKTPRVDEEKDMDGVIEAIVLQSENETITKKTPIFFEELNYKFKKNSPKIILERDKEIEKIFIIFQKMTTKNIVLIGEAGVGKTAIVEGLAERIVKGNCPVEFKNKRVLELDINSLIQDTSYMGQREKKINELKDFLMQNEDVILFIDEIHNVIGAGRVENDSYDLANALKPILTSGKIRVIGATTEEEYEKYFSKDEAFKRRFSVLEVAEPKSEKLYNMLQGKLYQLQKYHQVRVSKEIFDFVVEEAKKHNPDIANPARTMELLDYSMVIAKNKQKDELEQEAVLEATKNGYTFKKAMFEPLNDKFQKKGPRVILGREDEIEKVFITFQKMTTRNVILVGKPGVGKTAILEGIAEKIVKGNCPAEFKDKIVLSLDMNGLMKNTKYVGEKEKRFYELKRYLEKHENVILFIDEIHNIVGAGKSEDNAYDLANALKPILTNSKVRIIGATTEEEYERYFAKDGALKRRFEAIEVEEPKIKKLYKMLQGRIHQLEEKHGVTVTKESFDKVVSEASGYNFEVANPSRTVDLLDTAMVIAKNHGKTVLDTRSILQVHKKNVKKFKKTNKKDLKSVAYHETGHYLAWKSLNTKFTNVTLLSIIPADNYIGVMCYEKKEEAVHKGRREYINEIAELLAGGIASEIKGYEPDSGIRNDREKATTIARNMVINYGMQLGESVLGKYNSFMTNDRMNFEYLSDAQKEELAQQTDRILEEAYQKAERILKRKEKQLEVIAQALIKKGSLTKAEIDGLYSGKLKIEDLPDPEWKLIK